MKPSGDQTAESRDAPKPVRRSKRPAELLDPRALLLGAALLVFVAAAFCTWQSWLIYAQASGTHQVGRVTQWETTALTRFVADTRSRITAALDSDAVTTALSRPVESAHADAVQAFKQALPDALGVDFYRADLNDVLGSDFSKFGYTKASMLVRAHQREKGAPLQSQIDASRQRRLVFAGPVRRDGQIVAYAYVQLPFDPLRKIFHEPSLSHARVDLRQGDGQGDLLIDSIGDDDSPDSLGESSTAIAGSLFHVSGQTTEFDTALPHTLWVSLPLAVALLGLGMVLLRMRQHGVRTVLETLGTRIGGGSGAEEQTLAQTLASSTPAKATKPAATTGAAGPAAAPKPTAPAILVDRSIFRAYDIRGVLGKTLDADVARQIGLAIGSEARARELQEIVVARDGRLSGPELTAALIEGLRGSGCDVIDIGAAATPVLYFATYHLNVGSGVMVTGSHNPPEYNGFKIVLGGETLSEDAIQELYSRITENRLSTGKGGLQTMDVAADYVERITGDVMVERKLKVVVDCGNGIPGAVAPDVIEGIGCEVLPLYCDVDGNFPNHHPDPSDPGNLQDLILSVKNIKADIGLAFDGDGDRLGVVTASGEVIYPDRLLMLFARDVLMRNPGAAIIYDVKCTGKLQPLILQAGGSPIMWKTGHSLIKAKMRETGAELAGEMSGHFFFRERWYGFDDGIYAAARLLEILASDAEERNPQEIFDGLPKGVSTPELKIPMEEGAHYRFIEKFKEKASFEGARVTTIDGIRADWPDGWGLVRASNTTPVLVLRFDADDDTALERIKQAFREQLLAVDAQLSLPF